MIKLLCTDWEVLEIQMLSVIQINSYNGLITPHPPPPNIRSQSGYDQNIKNNPVKVTSDNLDS